MPDSMARPAGDRFRVPAEQAGWQTLLNWAAALLLGLLFLASGGWKITDPLGAAVRMGQARVPASLSLAAALGFGIAETCAGVFLFAPRYRRWGAALAALLLAAFLAYAGLEYGALRGQDCSCFPWIKRVVGPWFFAGDGAMLLLAGLATVWSPPSRGLRGAVLVAGCVAVCALVSFGAEEARQTGARTPASLTVAGQPFSLERGKVFLFFFHPECMKCFADAQTLARLRWGDTQVVAVPVGEARFAPQFLADTGLRALVSTDFETLKRAFHYVSYPFGVALEDGREKAALTNFEGPEPQATLKSLGFAR